MRKEAEEAAAPAENPHTAADVAAILRARGWLTGEPTAGQAAWCERAAALLGPQAPTRAVLEELLALVFTYNAAAVLGSTDAHAVLARAGARRVLRLLAHELLDGPAVDSDRLKEIVTAVRERLDVPNRALFHPLRLALAGRTGEGELDRVVLLLDAAAAAEFAAPVKGTRARVLEFISALD
jgi:glutamyl/glutaminyl-tRNA synthetase